MSLIKNLIKDTGSQSKADHDSKNNADEEKKSKPIVKSALDLQRLKVEKLMKNPDKPVIIPEHKKEKDFMQSVPTFVRNVMGSSAGAGSGEFHVYRHLRRKEYARQKMIQSKSHNELLDEEYQQKVEANRKKAEEKTAKKRAKRLKKKSRIKKSKPNVKSKDDFSEDENTKESESDTEEINASANELNKETHEVSDEDKGSDSRIEEINTSTTEILNNETHEVSDGDKAIDSRKEEISTSTNEISNKETHEASDEDNNK